MFLSMFDPYLFIKNDLTNIDLIPAPISDRYAALIFKCVSLVHFIRMNAELLRLSALL